MGSSTTARTGSVWGTAAWWTIVTISVPFAAYAAIFVYGDFDVYKQYTLNWMVENDDVAGRNIQQHIRAWQIHSMGAELFLVLGAFQFSRPFRSKYPAAHRRMGYAFVAVATAISVSAAFMIPYSEFSTLSKTVFYCQGCAMPALLFTGVWMARQKKFQTHQKFMIRGAATGYAVIGVRIFIEMFTEAGVGVWLSSDLAAIFSVVVFVGLAEIYIQTVLKTKPGLPISSAKEETAKLLDHEPPTLGSPQTPSKG